VVALASLADAMAAQPRLHLPPRLVSGAVELAVRLQDSRAAVWVRAEPPHTDWVRLPDTDKRECANEVHVVVLVLPGTGHAGARVVADGVGKALSGLMSKHTVLGESLSAILRQRTRVTPLTEPSSALAALEAQYGEPGEPPLAVDLVVALGNARKLLEEQRVQTRGRGRYLVLVVVDGELDLGDPSLVDRARELVESEAGIELYRIATGRLASAFDEYAGYANGPDLATAGELLRETVETCHIIRIRGLDAGTTRIRIGSGPSGPSWTSPEVTMTIAKEDLESPRGAWPWWIWAGAAVVVGLGAVMVGAKARSGGTGRGPRGTLRSPHAQVMVRPKTIRAAPTAGRLAPLDPVATSSSDTIAQLPPPGLAAWLVVYRDGTPYETLVLQTTGVTSLGRASANSIQLDDPTVSKRHATITARAGYFIFEDTADPRPQTPTRVNDKHLDGPTELRDGMYLQIGATRLRFKCTA
jgi:hypothetical protein